MKKRLVQSFASVAFLIGSFGATSAATEQEKTIDYGWRTIVIATDPCLLEKSHAVAMAVLGASDKPVLFFTCGNGTC